MSHTGNYGPGQYWWKLTFLSKFVINEVTVHPGAGNSLKGIEALIDGKSLQVISSDVASLPFTIEVNGKTGILCAESCEQTCDRIQMLNQ